jgi:Cft2 family RNA processing exonuclease
MPGDLPETRHHGTVDGVTGSRHELCVDGRASILVDCELFQGAETSPRCLNRVDPPSLAETRLAQCCSPQSVHLKC